MILLSNLKVDFLPIRSWCGKQILIKWIMMKVNILCSLVYGRISLPFNIWWYFQNLPSVSQFIASVMRLYLLLISLKNATLWTSFSVKICTQFHTQKKLIRRYYHGNKVLLSLFLPNKKAAYLQPDIKFVKCFSTQEEKFRISKGSCNVMLII